MRTNAIWALLIVPLLAAGLALGAPKGASAAAVCGDTPSGIEEITGTVRESVVVQANSTCNLIEATVRGGVTVGEGAILYSEYSEIRGPVSGTGVISVDIWGGVVRGGVTVSGAEGFATVESVEVRGDVVITGVGEASLNGSTVHGSATLNDNGHVIVHTSTIEEDLTCVGNGDVDLEEYGPNTVEGVTNCPAL